MENPLGRFLAHSALLRRIADFKGAFKSAVVAPRTNGDSLMSAIALIPLLILPFSPFLAFFIGLAIMLTFAEAIRTLNRGILAIGVIIAASFLNGDSVLHSDFRHYFRVYNALLNGSLKEIFYFGNGFEIALPLTYLTLGKIFGSLEPAHFQALNIFVAAGLFYLWLEKCAFGYMKDSQKALCVAFALIFFHFWFAGWLVRQEFSSIFILYALASKKWQNALIFSIIATAFHASAAFFLIVGFLLVYRPKLGMFLCVGIALIFYNFKDIAEAIYHSGVNNPLFVAFKSKLYPYVVSQSSLDGQFIGIRALLLSLTLGFFSYFYTSGAYQKWRYFVLGMLLLYATSFFVSNHFSLRIGVIIQSISFGFFLYLALRRFPLLVRALGFFALLNEASVRSYFGDLTNTMIYYNYDIIGGFFHYLF